MVDQYSNFVASPGALPLLERRPWSVEVGVRDECSVVYSRNSTVFCVEDALGVVSDKGFRMPRDLYGLSMVSSEGVRTGTRAVIFIKNISEISVINRPISLVTPL
jgi:hypothetical protein